MATVRCSNTWQRMADRLSVTVPIPTGMMYVVLYRAPPAL